MWRLTMSDGAALLSPELDASGRAAAIAAMASRLAAAGPRTRRRVFGEPAEAATEAQSGTHAASEPPPLEAPPPLLDFPRERLATVSSPAPAAWRQHIGKVGNAALLAAMAGAGFGAVILAQSPGVAALFRGDRTAVVAHSALLSKDVAPQAASAATNQQPKPRHLSAKLEQAASGPHKAITATHVPAHGRLLAQALAEPARTMPRRPLLHASALPGPRIDMKQPVAADYALPRWLTDAQPLPAQPVAQAAPPQPVTMSPPPHDLALPQTPAPEAKSLTRPPPPKPRPPDMIFASSSSPQTPSYGWPQRPAFAPPHGYYGQP
jgi:hypothetical protein